MKIAITSDFYYPMTNGVAVFSHNLAKGLAKRGHEVMVICPSFTGKYHVAKKDGVKVVYLSSVRFPFYPDQVHTVPEKTKIFGLSLPRVVYKNGIRIARKPYRELRKALDDFQPDVIHNQMVITIAMAVRYYVKHHNPVPLVSTGHAYPDNLTGQMKWLHLMKKPTDAIVRTYFGSFLKMADYVTAPTETAVGDLVPGGAKNLNVPVEALSNGVDLSEFKPGRADERVLAKCGLVKNRPRVLYVGRVDPEKSIEKVLEAFKKVCEKNAEVELVVVGDGTAKVELEKRTQELGLRDRVRFLGKILPPELVELYRSGTLFVTASKTETQGIVLIEAAAVGLPLVAVNAGAVKEICVNGVNGILCRPDDTTGLAKAMLKILGDTELAQKMGENSLVIAKKHDLNNTLSRFEEIYRFAISMKKNAR